MTRTEASRTVAATPAIVFQVLSDAANFAKAVPAIRKVEFLSEVRNGVGTRFRETRVMRGREAVAVMEVTEHSEGERICFRSDAGGAVWDSTFAVAPIDDDRTRLHLIMEARPYRLLAKLFVPVLRGMVAKAVESDMDAVKAYCERPADGVGAGDDANAGSAGEGGDDHGRHA